MVGQTLGRFLVGQGSYPRSGIKSAPPAGIIGFPGAAVGAIPFVFPFAPLGLGLFDTDPQRLLSLLHHQSALAEEALRYRSLLFGGASAGDIGPGSPTATSSQPPLLDDCKEPLNLHAATTTTTTPANTNTTTGNNVHDHPEKAISKLSGTSPKVAMTMIRVRDGLTKEGFRNGGGEELLLRKPPPPTPSVSTSSFAPSSSSSSSTCDDALSLFRDVHQLSSGSPTPATSTPTASNDTKCHICMANFPSVWLLEQHSALQHPHLTIHDDKPYLCGLCGQKSRYACCRYRTVLAKHHRTEPGGRSRVPADKLFTCDVCGMQFRYLKSFKKHRLNHALERLHGKKGSGGVGTTPADSEPAVSSTNESGDGAAASSAMVADLRSLTACADGDAESVHGDGGAGAQEKSSAVCGEIAVAGSTVTTGGDEQDDTVSDSALNQPSTVQEDSAGPSAGTGAADDTQAKISSSSNSATSTTRNTNCHTNGISNHCTNGGGGGNVSSCQTNSNSTGVTRMVQSPMEATNETLLAGELKRYQVAAVAAAAAAANSAAHHHASVVRSMEAESSSAHATGGNSSGGGGGGGSSGNSGGVLQHGLPPSGSSTGPSSLSHTLNSLINAETIPHHRLLGLDPQEASILNFLRVDAAEKQRDRRFACPFCGKCVRSKENLKLHVRKHTGERPFVCLFCGRAFGGKSDLTRHLRIHTGERPYHCEACGKCFARADYLSKHLTTHVHQLSPRP